MKEKVQKLVDENTDENGLVHKDLILRELNKVEKEDASEEFDEELQL